MGNLLIIADGKSEKDRANSRGRIFESLMADVLRKHGYQIDSIPNRNYAGMEIDIEGRHITTGIPLYAECKCYQTEIDCPTLQKFFGKYHAKWHKDNRSHGLFIASPSLNSHAKPFYDENCEGNDKITVRLLENDKIFEAIIAARTIIPIEQASKYIDSSLGNPGDWNLIFSDLGEFWLQYVIPIGSGRVTHYTIFDKHGNCISDVETKDYFSRLCQGLSDFDYVEVGMISEKSIVVPTEASEQIVEVRGSSEWFEYQFPASPQFFVGRNTEISAIRDFVKAINNSKTSSRGLLLEGYSGFGKSSLVLSGVTELTNLGHFAIAIDSRSASSSQFILKVVEHIIVKFGNFDNTIDLSGVDTSITGFEGAIKLLHSIGSALKLSGRILFIFLDQFENIFYLPDVISRVRDLYLKLTDINTNIVLGFSWKTDLYGLPLQFPYQTLEAIKSSCKIIPLDKFTDIETNRIFEELTRELRAKLRDDLKFFLSEFSQGYPWLLKRLCAHVISQRKTGVLQADIAKGLLNVESLFKEDLKGLSTEQEDTLRKIAKSAPISERDLGEFFKPDVIQSLINDRLIVRIGTKYDVYWDIFRDYLNTGSLPVQENYILRMQIVSILKSAKILRENRGILPIKEFLEKSGLNESSMYNVVKEMRLLGIGRLEDGNVSLQVPHLPSSDDELIDHLRLHVKERLRRNRLTWQIIEQLKTSKTMSVDDISKLLSDSCPYITASNDTWTMYAKIFASWLDFSDLVIYEPNDKTITIYTPGTGIRERKIISVSRRGGISVPSIQYKPIEKIAIRIVEAVRNDKEINWSGLKPSTIRKALLTLEDFGLINRKRDYLRINQPIFEFVDDKEKRKRMFADAALKMNSFKVFIEILNTNPTEQHSQEELAIMLNDRMGKSWKEATAKTNIKIMMDWAKKAALAPEVYMRGVRGKSTNITIKNHPELELDFD